MGESYLWYEELMSDEWATFLYVLYSVMMPVVIVVTLTHTSALLTSKRRINRSVRKLGIVSRKRYKRDVLIYFWFELVTFSICVPIYLSDSFRGKTNESIEKCNINFQIAAPFYLVGKLLMFRLLLSKSLLYDPMSQAKILAKVAWWMTNVCYVVVMIYAIVSSHLWSNEKVKVEGEPTCIIKTTFQTKAALYGSDIFISVICLIVLAGPTLDGKSSKDVLAAAVRNLGFGFLAVATTTTMLIYILIASLLSASSDSSGFDVVQILIDILIVDSFLNFVSISLCWPLRFYLKVISMYIPCLKPLLRRKRGNISRITSERTSHSEGKRHSTYQRKSRRAKSMALPRTDNRESAMSVSNLRLPNRNQSVSDRVVRSRKSAFTRAPRSPRNTNHPTNGSLSNVSVGLPSPLRLSKSVEPSISAISAMPSIHARNHSKLSVSRSHTSKFPSVQPVVLRASTSTTHAPPSQHAPQHNSLGHGSRASIPPLALPVRQKSDANKALESVNSSLALISTTITKTSTSQGLIERQMPGTSSQPVLLTMASEGSMDPTIHSPPSPPVAMATTITRASSDTRVQSSRTSIGSSHDLPMERQGQRTGSPLPPKTGRPKEYRRRLRRTKRPVGLGGNVESNLSTLKSAGELSLASEVVSQGSGLEEGRGGESKDAE